MKPSQGPTRRVVLGGALGGAAVAGVAAVVSCKRRGKNKGGSTDDGAGAAADTLRSALSTVFTVVGPWPDANSATRAEFLRRYLTEERIAKEFAEIDEPAIRSVAGKLASAGPAAEEIDLEVFTDAERVALLSVTETLYSVMEVRHATNDEPPPGTCMGNLEWHTLPPKRG